MQQIIYIIVGNKTMYAIINGSTLYGIKNIKIVPIIIISKTKYSSLSFINSPNFILKYIPVLS